MSDSSAQPDYPILSADLQIRFSTRLQLIRTQYLNNSLSTLIGGMDIPTLDSELAEFVGQRRLASLARYQLRGESFYPAPSVLSGKPLLLGYYRLLYGFSQKEFYHKGPFGRFKPMEEANRLSHENAGRIPGLCRSLVETAWELFQAIEPISLDSIHELQLLTLGPQLRGSENNVIGQGATRDVFELVRRLVGNYLVTSTQQVIALRNDSGRSVQIAFASDPDIAVVVSFLTLAVPTVSIEIKGGADVSNIHNRIGEAEKSHQKAKAAGYTQFWTILRARINVGQARRESPTTTEFFNLEEIMDEDSPGHSRFRSLLYNVVGIA
ncbi:MAG TPA: XcyI family restriction endonuclease [Armatimonadota bacterium]|nr:XcyI family restriction endonuclease [Armatimonadota bacterium]